MELSWIDATTTGKFHTIILRQDTFREMFRAVIFLDDYNAGKVHIKEGFSYLGKEQLAEVIRKLQEVHDNL